MSFTVSLYFDTHPYIYLVYTMYIHTLYWTLRLIGQIILSSGSMYNAHYYYFCWPVRASPPSVLTTVRPSAWSLPPQSPPNQHYQPSLSPRSLQPRPKSWCRSPAKSNQYVSAWTYNQQCSLLLVKFSWEILMPQNWTWLNPLYLFLK